MGQMKIMLIGPPGAGKGTQAKRICERFSLAHISTGDILRAEIKAGSALGLSAKSYLDSGALVPDDVILGIVKNRIEQDDCKAGFLFDGFPRTLVQAQALAQIVALDAVIALEVPKEALIRRISGRRVCRNCGATTHVNDLAGKTDCSACGGALYQRDDDAEATVAKRLEVYEAQTQPLIDFYRGTGVLTSLDGERPIDAVFADVLPILEKLSK